jgi:hypothetical protein
MWTWDKLIKHIQDLAEHQGIEGVRGEDLEFEFVARVKVREEAPGEWCPRLSGHGPVALSVHLDDAVTQVDISPADYRTLLNDVAGELRWWG